MASIIYTCGDSHTAGGETVDHLLWPDQHPGFYGLDELDLRNPKLLRRWREFRDRKLRASDPVGFDQWQDLENQNAWPSQLGKSSHIVKNAAVIGQSMEWVARQTCTDVFNLLKTDDAANVTVMIQPPTHVRLQRYDVENRAWHSFQLGNDNSMDPRVHEWFVNNEDDESLLTRWMISVMGLCSTLKNLGVRVILINAGMPDMNAVLEQHRILNQLRDDLGSSAIADMYQQVCGSLWHPRSMWDLAHAVDKPYCPDLHWRKEVHQLLAQDLLDSYYL